MGLLQRTMESMVMNPDFWRGRKVFVTGHSGFKGSWLCLWLQDLGSKVTGYSLGPPTSPSLFEQAHVAENMHSIEGDVRDLDILRKCMQEAQPEIVIHLAAQSLVRYSYKNPVETYTTNIIGTVNLLEAVRETKSVRAVINVTTDKCYENTGQIWGYRENDRLGGHDPYSNSKGCAEMVSAAYRSSFFCSNDPFASSVALATARAGNVIGGGDWAKDRLIPDIVAAFSNQQNADIRHPGAVRPWQHVLEPLRGYLMLAEQLVNKGDAFAEAWNFGPLDDDTTTVDWIVTQMAERWGGQAQWQADLTRHPHEAGYLKLDISKTTSRLDWKPVLRLEDALNMIVDWAKSYKTGIDARTLTQQQIYQYQQLVQN